MSLIFVLCEKLAENKFEIRKNTLGGNDNAKMH